MKVFAEYFKENNLCIRKNTILQFGDSWELLGNAVLANPGSAKPKVKIDTNQKAGIDLFYTKYRTDDKFNKDNWFEFLNDPTMEFVGKIFNGFYINKNIELNGVIQLFNTFNLKNQNLDEAIKQIHKNNKPKDLFSAGIEKYFHDKPTYFGFSKSVLDNDVLREVAEEIFNNSSSKIKSIYKKEFLKNSFYHPMYVNRAYNQEHFQQYKQDVLVSILKNA